MALVEPTLGQKTISITHKLYPGAQATAQGRDCKPTRRSAWRCPKVSRALTGSLESLREPVLGLLRFGVWVEYVCTSCSAAPYLHSKACSSFARQQQNHSKDVEDPEGLVSHFSDLLSSCHSANR